MEATHPEAPPDSVNELTWVNGQPGFVIRTDGGTQTVLTVSVEGDASTHLRIVVNPDDLGRPAI